MEKVEQVVLYKTSEVPYREGAMAHQESTCSICFEDYIEGKIIR